MNYQLSKRYFLIKNVHVFKIPVTQKFVDFVPNAAPTAGARAQGSTCHGQRKCSTQIIIPEQADKKYYLNKNS